MHACTYQCHRIGGQGWHRECNRYQDVAQVIGMSNNTPPATDQQLQRLTIVIYTLIYTLDNQWTLAPNDGLCTVALKVELLAIGSAVASVSVKWSCVPVSVESQSRFDARWYLPTIQGVAQHEQQTRCHQ
jgi:hypothetical protein